MPKVKSRAISVVVQRELWARTAGRCQFNGCNKTIYKSSVTQECLNISQNAHIYSYSPGGPRGWGPYENNLGDLNSAENLMLLCGECHLKIDRDEEKYPASLLKEWKRGHERRIEIVTGIAANKKTNIVFYGSNIGDQKSPIEKNAAIEAVFPEHYPAEENVNILSMICSHKDKTPEFWKTEEAHLEEEFKCQIERKITQGGSGENPVHFSIFSLAPIPLLIKLGTLFTDKINVNTYQLMREPRTWKWQEFPEGFNFIVKEPESFSNPPVLVMSLTDKISDERVIQVVGEKVSIWEITSEDKFIGNDMIRSKVQLSIFRDKMRKLIAKIKEKHGIDTPLCIFPAMGISYSVELGRIRMPKADMPWIIYDQNNDMGRFIQAITIGGDNK